MQRSALRATKTGGYSPPKKTAASSPKSSEELRPLLVTSKNTRRKPGCRRIVEWAKKTGRIQGAEQQELLDFARKTLEQAERNGDIINPVSTGGGDEEDSNAPAPKRPAKNSELVGTSAR